MIRYTHQHRQDASNASHKSINRLASICASLLRQQTMQGVLLNTTTLSCALNDAERIINNPAMQFLLSN